MFTAECACSELASRGSRVFLDAKLLDIEATVERATAAIARTRAEFLTCTPSTARRSMPRCGEAAAASSSCSASPCSQISDLPDLIQQGTDIPPGDLVLHRAMLARKAASTAWWLPGQRQLRSERRQAPVSSSSRRASGLRKCDPGPDSHRHSWKSHRAGADYLVVGRPITAAPDPRVAAEAIVADIESALSS